MPAHWRTRTGVVAPIVCIAVFLIAGLLRPGYNPIAQWGSELEIGPLGWLQRVNFTLFGALEIVFASGLRRELGGGKRVTAGAVLVGVFALGWVVVGLCVDSAGQLTWRTRAHIWGTRLFLALPIACLVLLPDLVRATRWPGLRAVTVATGVLGVLLAPGLYELDLQTLVGDSGYIGLYQRVYYLVLLAWLEVVALRLAGLRLPHPSASEARSAPMGVE